LKYDLIIIGGGIVGMSTALQMSKLHDGKKILLLEKESELSFHQTGNNSGVIHSGIYYKPKSLKAINCLNGYKMLLNFCRKNEIEHEICGKLIVATKKDELITLNHLYETGIKNGLNNLKILNRNEIKEYEPYCDGLKAIYVPQSGIIDYKKVVNTMADLFKKNGGKILLNSKVIKLSNYSSEIIVQTQSKEFSALKVINCSGLYSDKVANYIENIKDVKIIPFRGEYYKLKKDKEYLVKNLIYPVPNLNFPFLGVHFTRMINGGVEAGPNAVLAFSREGYNFYNFNKKEFQETIFFKGFRKIAFKYWKEGLNEMYRSFSKKAFTKALKRLVPEICEDDLVKGGSGVRAQACSSDGNLIDDFYFHKSDNIVNVINAPSPAATSALSIAESIMKLLKN
tara:strand:- start:229 stop:1419 length:1191 start_codon:yes stop_codon:yes gene_type:complete